MIFGSTPERVLSIEEIRKQARVLVIDDHAFPAQRSFERDGYHLERWPEIKNLSQLTDNHYHLILLDIHGVGLRESPQLQGLGILRHVKNLNPAQPVILYSSQPQSITSRDTLTLADVVLDKSADYIAYKEEVDRLLSRRASRGYFVSVMNRELSDQAILVPKAVPLASRALSTGSSRALERYLRQRIPDTEQVDRIINVISIGVGLIGLAQ